jgi:hypothetical protein
MAGIEDLNTPNDPNILGDLQFTPEPSAFALLENNLLQGVPLLDAIKQVGIDRALNLSGLDYNTQQDIKKNLPINEAVANFVLPKLLDNLQVPDIMKNVLLTGKISIPFGESGQIGVNASLGEDPSLRFVYDYQPNEDTFFNAGIVYGQGRPAVGIEFGKKFSQGGIAGIESLNLQYTPESDEDVTATELINHLSKQGIKVVDYDENEDSIKNRLFSMVGEQPRGHIFPSSWLDPSGELTIYVPTYAKKSPTAFKRFLVEEVKHADQIREAPFSTAASAIYEGIKEKASQLPYRLLSKLPDFVSEEEREEYFQKLRSAGVETGSVGGRDIDEIESPYWKERSGIGQLFRDLRYRRYADPESVEGIHRNIERYAPVLKKYGIADIDIFS